MKHVRAFHLKQFSLEHQRSTMKVGTDALLLGLWVGLDGVKQILEIGTGCGIISLLLASRCKAEIQAIDIDKASVDEAKINFNNSPFHYRIQAFRSGFQEIEEDKIQLYDLIISNPPFFINDTRSDKETISNARHGDTLSFVEICKKSIQLLQPTGKLALVLPYDESREFINMGVKHGLFLENRQLIFPKRGLQPNRVNLIFGFKPCDIKETKFVIREENGDFSQEYNRLFKDYLIASG